MIIHKSTRKYSQPGLILCLFLCFLQFTGVIFPGSLSAQVSGYGTIAGTLLDSETFEPLPTAHIYLSNTTLGTSSNPDGSFEIRNIPPGNYTLVFRFIGYELTDQPVRIREGDFINVGKIAIVPQVHELGSIDVDARRPRDWLRNLRYFESIFIGRSANADKTEIINPEILEFNRVRRSGILHAESAEELHIQNHSLGYELFVMLRYFIWNTNNDSGEYYVSARFVELEPENEQQQKEWEENRLMTYSGSFRHFLQSLLAGTNEQEFQIINGSLKPVRDIYNYKKLIAQLFENYPDPNQAVYQIEIHDPNNPFEILYRNRHLSQIRGRNDDTLKVDSYGNVLNWENIIISGHWHGYRISDLLPDNYEGYELIPRNNAEVN